MCGRVLIREIDEETLQLRIILATPRCNKETKEQSPWTQETWKLLRHKDRAFWICVLLCRKMWLKQKSSTAMTPEPLIILITNCKYKGQYMGSQSKEIDLLPMPSTVPVRQGLHKRWVMLRWMRGPESAHFLGTCLIAHTHGWSAMPLLLNNDYFLYFEISLWINSQKLRNFSK